MTRTKKTDPPDVADSAPHAAPAPGPVPGTVPAPDSAVPAIQAALAAHPDGATTADIASAAGISRAAAGKALAEMETAGTAERTKGGRPGIPDTWRLAAAPAVPANLADTASADAADDEDTVGDAGAPALAPEQETAGAPGNDETGPSQDEYRGNGHPIGSTQDAAEEPSQDGTAGTDAPGDDDAPHADSDGGVEAPPDPTATAAIAAHAGKIRFAADAVTTALEVGDLGAALAAIEDIWDQAGQARRTLKAATGGRKGPSIKPGALRELVAAHLRAYPSQNFTPHQIGKKLTRSSGAVANALDKLVALGEAELATEKPRSFRLAPDPATPPANQDTAIPSGDETADGQAIEGPPAASAA